jgi:hypothetical protein
MWCMHWVEVSRLSIGSGMTWCPKEEEGVLQRIGITMV